MSDKDYIKKRKLVIAECEKLANRGIINVFDDAHVADILNILKYYNNIPEVTEMYFSMKKGDSNGEV